MTEPTGPAHARGPNALPPADPERTWAAGDQSRVATAQTIVGELLCEAVELHARERVLDVATGSGNTALAAARRRGQVVGVDFVPALLERARQRAEVEGLRIEFKAGRVEALPFEDHAFDCVLSTFGAMFSETPAQAAHELLRVCRPAGRIGLANWTPDSFVGELFRVVARHVPALDSVARSTRWGTEAGLEELFGPRVAERRVARRVFAFRADSPEAYVGFFRQYFGPTVTAFAALPPEGQTRLEGDLLEAVRRANRALDGTTYIPADYLEIVLVRA
jgi:ubiquinone/menaquinone biosynthesis C-methylase UbiE